MRDRIRAGLEIELIYNPLIMGEIERGRFKDWRIKGDGSLNYIIEEDNFKDTNGDEMRGRCLEFESKIFKTKKAYFKAIEDFKKKFKSDTYKLSDVLSFNKTCGLHLHISLSDYTKLFYNKIDYLILKQLREHFFKLVSNSEVLSLDAKRKIKQHYFRYYARELKKDDWTNRTTSRYLEFNKHSEMSNKGLEWRGFNLYGVKNWDELDEMFKISFNCLEFLFKKRTNGYKFKTKTIRLKRTRFKQILKQQNNKKINVKNLNAKIKGGLLRDDNLNLKVILSDELKNLIKTTTTDDEPTNVNLIRNVFKRFLVKGHIFRELNTDIRNVYFNCDLLNNGTTTFNFITIQELNYFIEKFSLNLNRLIEVILKNV